LAEPSLVRRLRDAGCVYAEAEAALLIEHASDPVVLDAIVARRVAGEPLEQLLGWVDFDGLRLAVGPGAFVPRQRTVGLARRAIMDLPDGGVLVDLCAGVGAVAAWVAHRRPDATVVAAELDQVPAGFAETNLPTGSVVVGDLFDPLPTALRGRVDVLTANAPYVPSDQVALMPSEARDHEPLIALDGGADGVDLHRRIVAGAAAWLTPTGRLLIESTAPQIALLAPALAAAGLRGEAIVIDESLTLLAATPVGRFVR
jgi:release factor glutamine methyltransferase